MKPIRNSLVLTALLIGVAHTAVAGQHTWNVNEVFSNASGTIQFVELVEGDGTPGEINVQSVTVSTGTKNFLIGGSALTPPTSNKFFLIATPGFAALTGAPTPDRILAPGDVPFFSTAGATVAYGAYDSWAFGTVPTNGTSSLNRTGGVLLNSPTNYAGATGSVSVASPAAAPALSGLGMALAVALLLVAGTAVLIRARR